jgi:hypothetical protein
MLDRALYRLRAALTEPRALLGSWKLSVALMVGTAVCYLMLAAYSWAVPSHVVASIASLSLYSVCWALLLVNTFVCIWNRWRATSRASVLFHASFFVIGTGLLLSFGSREESRLRVAAGERFENLEEQFIARAGTLGPSPFTAVSITPGFWRDQLLFTRLEAVLDFDGAKRTTRINRPLWLSPATFLRLSGFGFAPRYEIIDAQGRVLETAFVKLNVFPPGQRDFLVPERFPYRVYLEVYPDANLAKDGIFNQSMNLARPLLVASVYRGHLAIASRPLRLGESLALEGVSIRFPEIGLWGEFSCVRDLGIPLIFTGALMALGGLTLTLFSGLRS